MFKILFFGDVTGRPGRETIRDVLPKLKEKYKVDLAIANVENAAGGVGVTREIVEELVGYGIDLCTSGDHIFKFNEFYNDLADLQLPIVRPANFEAPGLPGSGYRILEKSGVVVAVINLLGNDGFTFSQRTRNPFWYIDEMLEIPEIKNADIRFIDFHAETTSEKLTFAWYVKDKVQTVVGTHTHVATADNRILGKKIAYVTDVGQVGMYEASLWVDFDIAIHNFKYPNRKHFEMAAEGSRICNAVLISYENLSPVSIDRVDIILD